MKLRSITQALFSLYLKAIIKIVRSAFSEFVFAIELSGRDFLTASFSVIEVKLISIKLIFPSKAHSRLLSLQLAFG